MIVVDAVVQVGGNSWRYEWTATTGPYRVYYRGVLVDTVSDVDYTITEDGATSEPPVLEILDANDTDSPEQMANPPRVRLQWYEVSGAILYRVKHYEDSAWVLLASIPEAGTGHYEYQSLVVDDQAEESWVIYAVDEYYNEGDPVEFHLTVIRNPGPPDVAMSYNSVTGDVTISAA